jgi:DNA-binding MarR family transcriptional regulator
MSSIEMTVFREVKQMERIRIPKTAEAFEICIPNEMVEILLRLNLAPYETRVLFFLLRQAFRNDRKNEVASPSTIRGRIGLDRRLVDRALAGLSSKKMILRKPDPLRKHRKIVELRDPGQWKLVSKKMRKS